jgi:hypothetical protein
MGRQLCRVNKTEAAELSRKEGGGSLGRLPTLPVPRVPPSPSGLVSLLKVGGNRYPDGSSAAPEIPRALTSSWCCHVFLRIGCLLFVTRLAVQDAFFSELCSMFRQTWPLQKGLRSELNKTDIVLTAVREEKIQIWSSFICSLIYSLLPQIVINIYNILGGRMGLV